MRNARDSSTRSDHSHCDPLPAEVQEVSPLNENRDFGDIWARIVSHEGVTFRQKGGKPFTSEVSGNAVKPSTRTGCSVAGSSKWLTPADR